MQTELLMIGTELLLGQIQDTNAAYMARVLAASGMNLYWKTTVGDNAGRIRDALRLGLERSNVVLCSGGLGPTADDITRECVAEVLGVPLDYHEALYQAIVDRFRSRNRPLTENNRRQAFLPRGARAIPNPNGTAPGIIAESGQGVIVCMPGVPRELQAMFEETVIPYLKSKYAVEETIHYQVLLARNVGESRVDQAIADLIAAQANPTIGLLASPGVVRIRIAAKAPSVELALAMIAPLEKQIRQRLESVADALEVEL